MNMASLRYLLIAPFLLGAAALHAEVSPIPFQAHYQVQVDGFNVGKLDRSLRHADDGSFVLESALYTTGLAAFFKKDRTTERSIWQLDHGHIVPMEYRFSHQGRGKDVVEALHFDWDQHRVTSLRDGKETEVPITDGTLDKMNYQIRLRSDLAAGKKDIDYTVADRGDIRTYRFRVLGEEQLDTKLGKLRTLKVERLSNNEKRKTVMWHAVDRDYLIVRLEQDDGSHTFASYITSAN